MAAWTVLMSFLSKQSRNELFLIERVPPPRWKTKSLGLFRLMIGERRSILNETNKYASLLHRISDIHMSIRAQAKIGPGLSHHRRLVCRRKDEPRILPLTIEFCQSRQQPQQQESFRRAGMTPESITMRCLGPWLLEATGKRIDTPLPRQLLSLYI